MSEKHAGRAGKSIPDKREHKSHVFLQIVGLNMASGIPLDTIVPEIADPEVPPAEFHLFLCANEIHSDKTIFYGISFAYVKRNNPLA